MSHLTRLSAGDTDVDDENERDGEDDKDDAINTYEIHLPNDDENCYPRENIDLVMVQQVVECENTRYVNLEVGDRSNNPEVEFEVENTSPVASQHGTQSHQEFLVYRSNASVLVLNIKSTECQWRLRAMTVKDRYLNSSFISEYIEALVKTEMTITVVAIQAVVKRKTNTRLFGDWYKSYVELSRFFLALENFSTCFWAFTPSIKGFTHCRPILSIDGTHLYGKYKGTLLIAMGCDSNNQLFPFAFAITKRENTNSWITQRKGLYLISNRHPSNIAVINETYSGWTKSDAYYRFCMRHLASNFNTKFKDKTLKDLMCRAAMESKVKKFISHMDTIGRINVEARNWLEHISLEKLALSHDGGRRYEIMTTNMSEVFNGILKGARNLPIIALHGASRLALGEEFTPYIDAKIMAKVVKAGLQEVVLYNHVERRFHVKTRHSIGNSNRKPRTYHVNLQTGSCTCDKTLLLGFPCSHILATCHCRAIDFQQFVQDYTTHAYLSTWAPLFYPIFDELDWPQYNGPIIVPSDSMKRLTSGRPKSSCLHNEMNARKTRTPQTCGLCKQLGHNRRSCPNRETNDRRS
ncbi:hypothetical protein AAG906_024871 [Vitis piasezkii]